MLRFCYLKRHGIHAKSTGIFKFKFDVNNERTTAVRLVKFYMKIDFKDTYTCSIKHFLYVIKYKHDNNKNLRGLGLREKSNVVVMRK
jgi:hypothetical protein